MAETNGNGDAARWRMAQVVGVFVAAAILVGTPVVAVVWAIGSMRSELSDQIHAQELRSVEKFATKDDLDRMETRLMNVFRGSTDVKGPH